MKAKYRNILIAALIIVIVIVVLLLVSCSKSDRNDNPETTQT